MSLATMRQPVVDRGLHAARLLLDSLLERPAEPAHLVQPTSLVVRGSTRPVRSGAPEAAPS